MAKTNQKAMESDMVAYFQAYLKKLLPNSEIVDLFMENSHLTAILDSGTRFKIKQQKI